ncbi:MAG: hypothetical protein ACOZIN_12435 [Myxococcota bacterium]
MRPLSCVVVLLSGCLSPRAELPARSTQAPTERYVDAFAPAGGDGSSQRPYRSLTEALSGAGPRPLVVHLATGMYQGPFRIEGDVALVGGKAAVLYADGAASEVVRLRDAQLERVHVQGGQVGVRVEGRSSLHHVHLSGQRQAALVLAEGAVLTVAGGELAGTVSETVGVRASPRAEANFSGTAFVGAFRRGVEVRGGRAQLTGCRFDGPVTALHLVGGEAHLSDVDVVGGRGPGVFAAQGKLTARWVRVFGHEYGLLTGAGAWVQVEDFSAVRPQRAGVALVGTRGHLADVVVLEGASYAGLQLLESELELRRVQVHRVSSTGLFARLGSLRLFGAVVTQVRGDGQSGGDGVELRGVKAELEDVVVRDVDGSGVIATVEAEVVAKGVSCARCRFGALVAERRSQVVAYAVEARGCGTSALVVPDEARLSVHGLFSRENAEGPLWAECGQGAQVTLTQVESDVPLPRALCIQADTRPP